MKLFLSFFTLTVLASFRFTETVYVQPLKTIDDSTINIGQYSGKKMLFIILPLTAADTTVTPAQLSALENRYSSTLMVIGVPSEEWGYSLSNKPAVKSLYQNQPANFILGGGLRVNKGGDQAALFQWLTYKSKNTHFDQDVQGTGTKFFVDEGGNLFAVMGPQVKLTNPLIDRIVTRPVAIQ